jgi:hypothetical protein
VHLGIILVNNQLDALFSMYLFHLHRVICTRWCIDTIDSPDDEHWVARNMWRSEINTLKKCVKLVINKNCSLPSYPVFFGISPHQNNESVLLSCHYFVLVLMIPMLSTLTAVLFSSLNRPRWVDAEWLSNEYFDLTHTPHLWVICRPRF